MPFIVRCPNPACQKYQLIEDQMRNGTIQCLVCKQPMKMSPSRTGNEIDTGDRRERVTVKKKAATRSAADTTLRQCPTCGSMLRFQANAESKKLRCPKCNTTF